MLFHLESTMWVCYLLEVIMWVLEILETKGVMWILNETNETLKKRF